MSPCYNKLPFATYYSRVVNLNFIILSGVWVCERERERERETKFFYIICWYSLYSFNELYVKIEIEMLGEL